MEPHHRHTSRSKLESCKLTWVIENALICFDSQEYLRSSVFGSDNAGKWKLEAKELGGFVHVWLISMNSQSVLPISAICNISILDNNGIGWDFAESPTHIFTANSHTTSFQAFQLQYLRYSQQRFLTNGKLTMICKVSRLVISNDPSGMNYKVAVLVPKCTLPDLFATLLQSDKHSDMIVEVTGQEIKAHKSFLALRSPVFAAMLDSPMKESRQNRVVISDCDYDVVKEMLHYIYTGKAPNVDKMAERLLVAADKYALDGLKAMCEQALCETLSVETAMNLLAVAEMYNANQLKGITKDFIKANLSGVISTADCEDLITKQALLQYPKKH